MSPTYHLARAADPGLVSAIVSAASGKPVGYTRWELDGPAEHTAGSWRVLAANLRPTGVLRSTERAAARAWAEMILGRVPPTGSVPPDVRDLATRALLLPHIQAELPLSRRGKRAARGLAIRYTTHQGSYTTGSASSGDWTIRIRAGTDPTYRNEVIVHEVCHLALDPPGPRGPAGQPRAQLPPPPPPRGPRAVGRGRPRAPRPDRPRQPRLRAGRRHRAGPARPPYGVAMPAFKSPGGWGEPISGSGASGDPSGSRPG